MFDEVSRISRFGISTYILYNSESFHISYEKTSPYLFPLLFSGTLRSQDVRIYIYIYNDLRSNPEKEIESK